MSGIPKNAYVFSGGFPLAIVFIVFHEELLLIS
jgi:hypothetical protein